MLKLKSVIGLLFLATLIGACKKDDDKQPADVPAPAEKVLPVYFKVTVNNVALVLETDYYNFADSISSGPGGSSFKSSIDTVTANFTYNSTIRDQRKNSKKFITVHVAQYYNYSLGMPLVSFDQVFTPGSRPFKYNLSTSLGQAVAIQYRDENEVYWSTAKDYIYAPVINIPKAPSFAGQPFELVSVEERPELIKNPRDTKHVLANMKFSCYLYNGNGDSIHFQNAEFQGIFSDIRP
jgi:hypothetical protein